MLIQDILPITSIVFLISGSVVMLFGIIWAAKIASSKGPNSETSNTDYIIEEMNQMFSYFTNKIDSKDSQYNLISEPKDNSDQLDSKQYSTVIDLSKKGKTSEEIAKQLDIGKGEVNLILGIEQMR